VSIEQRFLQFADLRPEALMLVTGSGTVQAANRRVEGRLGVAPRDLVRRPLADFVAEPPAEVERYLRACARSRELVLGALTWQRPGAEAQALSAEGAVFQSCSEDAEALVLLALTPREAASGGISALTQQIDALSRELARLAEREDRLRLAVEAAEMGTWDFDPASGRLQWSERCKAMFGLPADAAVSYPSFLGLVHPEDRARTDEAVRRALDPADPAGYDIEYRAVWPDGMVRWLRARGRAFF
jgi:PAS domain S-box-containing protein